VLTLLGGACTAKIEEAPHGGVNAPGPGNLGPGPQSTLVCQPGLTACGTVCVDLQSASDNCGVCGTACTAPASHFGQCFRDRYGQAPRDFRDASGS
jgi:hypothetical protein